MTPRSATSALVLLSWLVAASSFSVVMVSPAARRTTFYRSRATTLRESTATAESDFGTAMPDVVDVYEQLGIEKGNLALGVKPAEVLKYIGT